MGSITNVLSKMCGLCLLFVCQIENIFTPSVAALLQLAVLVILIGDSFKSMETSITCICSSIRPPLLTFSSLVCGVGVGVGGGLLLS